MTWTLLRLLNAAECARAVSTRMTDFSFAWGWPGLSIERVCPRKTPLSRMVGLTWKLLYHSIAVVANLGQLCSFVF